MSLEEFTSFVFQARDYLVPLARLTMRFCIRFMLDFSSQTGMLQGFLDRMLGDFEGEDSVGKVFVFGFIVDLLELFLQSLQILLQRLQLIFLGFAQLSHDSNFLLLLNPLRTPSSISEL